MLNQEEPSPADSEQVPSEALQWTEAAALDAQQLRASALRQARWLVDFYRITPDELRAASATVGVSKVPSSSQAQPVKYRHPVSGDTWDGIGPHPQWMRQALLHDGYRVEELRVNHTQEDQDARTSA